MDIWEFEHELIAGGYGTVCGVDEAGRGPLAGPVFAAAVILPCSARIIGLDDSKKLSERARERLFEEIVATAAAYGISSASHSEIDELNILNATFLAMNRAVEKLGADPDIVLIDGNRDPGIRYNSRCIVGGDGKYASIAAASILAKVSRDRYMGELGKKYPQYGFEKHKGYGTKLHYERLNEFGPSEIHRSTFLKKWKMENEKRKSGDGVSGDSPLNFNVRNSLFRQYTNGSGQMDVRQRGKWGEELALEYLKRNNYVEVAQGFRSRFGEIDLIVRNSEFLVFVEVKLRKNADFAYAREYVGKAKQRKMTTTANLWLAMHNTRLQPRFDVIEIYAPEGENNVTPEIIHIENAF